MSVVHPQTKRRIRQSPKRLIKLLYAVVLISLAPGHAISVMAPTFDITGFSVSGSTATLTWNGGIGPFQIQSAPTATGPYTNLGEPIDAQTAMVAASSSPTFYRIIAEQTARYQVTFDAVWSPATHPINYPGGAHWSGLVGGTHNGSVTFWEPDGFATTGIKNMAELGSQSALLQEVSVAIEIGTAEAQLSGGGISGGSGSVSLTFDVSRDFPLVTLTSMIAPSPDWFIGVNGESLLENNHWVDSKVVPLYLHDAGTDAGPSYPSPNQPQFPFAPIARISGFPALVDSELKTFGAFTFTRIRD